MTKPLILTTPKGIAKWPNPKDHPVTTQKVKLIDIDLDPLSTLKKVKAFIDCEKSLKEAK